MNPVKSSAVRRDGQSLLPGRLVLAGSGTALVGGSAVMVGVGQSAWFWVGLLMAAVSLILAVGQILDNLQRRRIQRTLADALSLNLPLADARRMGPLVDGMVNLADIVEGRPGYGDHRLKRGKK